MHIKLIVSDVDGTLLDELGQIPAKLVQTVDRCRKQGIVFSLATGRTRELAQPVIDALKIDAPCVIANGAMLFQNGTCLRAHGFGADPVLSLIRQADEEGLTVTCSDERSERAIRNTDYVREHQTDGSFTSLLDMDRTDWKKKRFQKIMFMDENRTGKILKYQEQLKQYSHLYWITTYSDMAVELGPKDCNKATGLRELAGILGIKSEEIMACGDYLNDLEMLKEAGVGVAVANAHEEVKRHADYVAEKPFCYGVIEAIHGYCF